jgi:hypothetical protein
VENDNRLIITNEEYEEFIKFMEDYNKKKQEQKDKFHDSLLYAIYQYFKK